jgi:hypothetical protein
VLLLLLGWLQEICTTIWFVNFCMMYALGAL